MIVIFQKSSDNFLLKKAEFSIFIYFFKAVKLKIPEGLAPLVPVLRMRRREDQERSEAESQSARCGAVVGLQEEPTPTERKRPIQRHHRRSDAPSQRLNSVGF